MVHTLKLQHQNVNDCQGIKMEQLILRGGHSSDRSCIYIDLFISFFIDLFIYLFIYTFIASFTLLYIKMIKY